MADAQIAALKAKKKNIKTSLTRFRTYLSKLSVDLTEEACIEINERLNDTKHVLIEFRTTFDALQTVLSATGGDPLDINEISNFEDDYFKAIAAAKSRISKYEQSKAQSRAMQQPLNSSISTNPRTDLKLPTISIKPFDGNIEQWGYFRDTFTALIHENRNLNDIEKFHYLRLYLTGAAAALLESFDVSAESYASAWDLLTKRFENKRLLANKHVSALFNLQNLTKESSKGLRQLLDDFTKHLRALQVLNQPTEQWDLLIIYLVTTKLDSATRREWENTKSADDFSTVAELKTFLTKKCQLLETLQDARSLSDPNSTRPKTQLRSFAVSAKPNCALCSLSDHFIYRCPQFNALSVKDRIAETKKLKLCLNCLKQGHVLKDCQSGTCRKCERKHNTLLHLEERPQSSELRCQNSQSVPTDSVAATTASLELSNHSYNQAEPYIVLSTALVYLNSSDGSKHKIRALLDSGSQSNFISSKLSNRLNLCAESVSVEISGVNQVITSVTHKVSDVEIQSLHNNFSIKLN